jgi:hypothetical protein
MATLLSERNQPIDEPTSNLEAIGELLYTTLFFVVVIGALLLIYTYRKEVMTVIKKVIRQFNFNSIMLLIIAVSLSTVAIIQTIVFNLKF